MENKPLAQIINLGDLIEETKAFCIDSDDVTADSFGLFVQFHNENFGTNLTVEDFNTRAFHPILGCTPEEARRRVDAFQHSSYFDRILPVEGAVESVYYLHSLGKKVYITTSRGEDIKRSTERFYASYFRKTISDIIHSANGHTGQQNSGRTKADVCFDLNAALIDDDIAYIRPCSDRHIYSVLFGNCAWSQVETLPPFTFISKSWKSFLEAA